VNRLLLSFAVALALGACAERDVAPESSGDAAVHVELTRAHRGPIEEKLDVPGETAARVSLRLTSPVAGRITFLASLPGDRLAAGAVGARVLPLENEAAVHGFALLEASGETTSDAARGMRDRLGRQDIPLTISFAATVAARTRNPGEQVAPGDVLLELFDPTSLFVLSQLPLGAADKVQPGMPVELTGSGIASSGRVIAVVPALEPQALTVPVRVSLDALPDHPLLHAPVHSAITVAQHPQALLVPRSSLISPTEGDRGTVMVAVGDKAKRREIRLGIVTHDSVEVLDGLADGEQVLSAGQYGLPDDTAIKPAASAAE
jgi:multidrug efflux pump subunit AcrA (membrane-fusion protein)